MNRATRRRRALALARANAVPADRQLYVQIANLTAGYPVHEVLQALCDHLAICAGFASHTPDEAGKLLASLAYDMAVTTTKNWDRIAASRAHAEGGRHA